MKKVEDNELIKALAPVVKPPSIREICKRTGLSSPQAVIDRLKRLSKLGYVEKIGNKYYPVAIKKMHFHYGMDRQGTYYLYTEQL